MDILGKLKRELHKTMDVDRKLMADWQLIISLAYVPKAIVGRTV